MANFTQPKFTYNDVRKSQNLNPAGSDFMEKVNSVINSNLDVLDYLEGLKQGKADQHEVERNTRDIAFLLERAYGTLTEEEMDNVYARLEFAFPNIADYQAKFLELRHELANIFSTLDDDINAWAASALKDKEEINGRIDTINQLLPKALQKNASGVVEQEAWKDLTLQNGWVHYGGLDPKPQYYKDSLGVVHLKGAIKSGVGTVGTIITTLPVGYRPINEKRIISTYSSDGTPIYTRLSINLDGTITTLAGTVGNVWLYLDCSFRI